MNQLPTILVYLGIGLGVGSLSGILRIGGGVLLVPALIGLCHFEPTRAAGTSLAVLMIPVCLPAAWKALDQGRVDLEAALWIAGAFVIGAYGGSSLAPYLSEATLRLLFGLLLIGVGLRFFLPSDNSLAALALLTALIGWFLKRRLLLEPSAIPASHPDCRSLEYHI